MRYSQDLTDGALCFRPVKPPTTTEREGIIAHISARIGRYLERQGLRVRDEESSHLALEAWDDAVLDGLLGHSITYRIAVGPHQGQKVFTLQTVPACTGESVAGCLAKAAGFSLHAGVAAAAHQRAKLERLCRYITRPAVSTQRLSLTNQGTLRYALKTPYRDGTTQVLFEPLDFAAPAHPCARGISASLHVIARLAALVPTPRVNLTRCHGVFAPNSTLRAPVTPGERGRRSSGEPEERAILVVARAPATSTLRTLDGMPDVPDADINQTGHHGDCDRFDNVSVQMEKANVL